MQFHHFAEYRRKHTSHHHTITVNNSPLCETYDDNMTTSHTDTHFIVSKQRRMKTFLIELTSLSYYDYYYYYYIIFFEFTLRLQLPQTCMYMLCILHSIHKYKINGHSTSNRMEERKGIDKEKSSSNLIIQL